jgi:hypothetical protein
MAENESIASSISNTWSETRTGRIAVIAGVVVLFVLVFWLAMRSRRMLGTLQETLYVPPEQLALGDIWETDRFSTSLTIYNSKPEVIRIRGIAPSCPCVSIQTGSLVVRPGESVTVPVVLDLTQMPRTKSSVDEVARFGVSLFPQIENSSPNSLPRFESWTITANVHCPFAFDRPRVDFGEVWLGGQGPVSQKISIVTRADIRGVKPEYDQHIITVNLKQNTQTQNRLELEVTPRRDLKPGIYETTIKLMGTAPDGQCVASSCKARIIALDDLYTIPSAIVGTKLIGEKICETVVVAARSQKAFEILGLETDSEIIALSPAGDIGEGVPKFHASVTVHNLGIQKHHITVHLRSVLDQIPSKITIPVRVHGVQYPTD